MNYWNIELRSSKDLITIYRSISREILIALIKINKTIREIFVVLIKI